MKRFRILLLSGLILSALLAAGQQQIPTTYFDMHTLFAGQLVSYATPWPIVPSGAIRLWDTGTRWSDIETASGVYNWATLDNTVQMAQSHGDRIEFTFGNTPAWAASAVTLPPANMTDWDNFVQAVATRYKGKIEAYEIWNEVNSTNYYTGTTAQLVTMQQHAYTIIKAADPAAIVLSPSFVGGGMGNLQSFLAGGATNYIDAVAVHLYPWPTSNPTPEANIPGWIDTYRSDMTQYGIGSKPIWNTEYGWGLDTDLPNADDQAAFLARSYLLWWSKGIARTYWYAYDNAQWGTLRVTNSGNPGTLSEAGNAYNTVYGWMVGSTMSQPCAADSNGIWSCQLTNANGAVTLAVWNPAGTSSYATGTYTQYQDLLGNVSNITGGAVTIGTKPILLQGSPAAIAVNLSPSTASVQTNGTLPFTATVSGTSNPAVTWSVTSGSGTVSSAGVYTAPSTAGSATIRAASAADTTMFATAAVTVTAPPAPVSVTVTPSTASVQTGGTLQLNAAVSGSTNTAVTWSVASGSGTVSSAGVYTAPSTAGSAAIKATSAADTTKSATATITITAPPAPVSVTVTPSTASVQTGGTLQLNAAVSGSTNTAVTWSVASGSGTVSSAGVYTAPSTAGSATVKATSAADTTKSATAAVTITAPAPVVSISITPSTATVSAGRTLQLTAKVSGTSNTGVTWSVVSGGGTISSSGVYHAPQTSGTATIRVTSKADSTKSANATIKIARWGW